MRNTGVTDVYGLSIPSSIESVAGTTIHRYITGDGFCILVTDIGAETVTVAIYMPGDDVPLEQHEAVAKKDVENLVRSLFGRYKY
jgi:hypothetical protein